MIPRAVSYTHLDVYKRQALRRTGLPPQAALVVGDRLYTDIACGVNAGVDAAFVLSGEGTLADLETSDEMCIRDSS